MSGISTHYEGFSYLPIIQMTEPTNNLLLVELIGLQFHAPDGLHSPVVLQPLLAGQHSCGWWGLLQTVNIAFLEIEQFGYIRKSI